MIIKTLTKYYFQLFLFVVALLCNCFVLLAQKINSEQFSLATQKKNYAEIEVLKKDVELQLSEFFDKSSELILFHQSESPIGKHFYFKKIIEGFPIENSYVKVNVTTEGKVFQAYHNLFKNDEVKLLKAHKKTNLDLSTFLNKGAYRLEKPQEKVWLLNQANLLELFTKVYVQQADKYFTLYFDKNKTLYQKVDRSFYFQSCKNHIHKNCEHHFNTDSLIQVSVFLPDPLTSAETYYGGDFVDNEDKDNEALNAQIFNKTVRAKFENDKFILENNFIKINDNLPPNTSIFQSQVPNFVLTRSDNGFEDVMVYYHISKFQEYIQSLGFSFTEKVFADPHSLNGADQSRFIADANGKIYLDFGEGNVDDAEDADVIIHEYIHALSYMANNSNTGVERRALDEAMGDYFATSWSRQFSNFRWQDMFTWDGHNEFWNGRNMQTNKRYPSNVTNDIYGSSEVFSSTLMEIYEHLGAEVTDKLALQLLYLLTPNMNMRNAANALLEADDLLFGSENKTVISQILYKRGLLTNLQISAGIDTVICLGNNVILGEEGWNFNGLQFNWISSNLNETIQQSDSSFINVNPIATTTYTLQTNDENYDTTYEDEVTIVVETCFNENENVVLLNTQNFANGVGDLLLYFSENVEMYDYKVYDLNGRIIKTANSSSNESTYLEMQNLTPGVYLIKIEINNSTDMIFKVLKSK